MISESGRPLICDFGISRWIEDPAPIGNTPSGLVGSLRWMAVEIVEMNWNNTDAEFPEQSNTVASDVWSFGMVIYVDFSQSCKLLRADITLGNTDCQSAIL